MQRHAACAHELGENELSGCVGAVGHLGCGLPVGERQEVAGMHLWGGSLGVGETVRNLDQYGSETCGADAGGVSTASVEVVDLAQQPADCADWRAEKTLRGEVAADWRRPHSKVNLVPVG